MPFRSGFWLGRWFVLLHAAMTCLAGCLTHGYWVLAGLLSLLLVAEISGLIGKRFRFMWSAAGWFRFSVVAQVILQLGLAPVTLMAEDPDLAVLAFIAGLLVPILFFIPMSRFRRAREIPALAPLTPDDR
jgi:hypothetical protein